jgi:acyl dehydratase
MAIDLGAVGVQGKPLERGWALRDALLYALGVGAGADELDFATERARKVFPTFALALDYGTAPVAAAGLINPLRMLHGSQCLELFGALPLQGRVLCQGRIRGIYDKGSGAVIETETESRDAETGELRFRTRAELFLRGEGGFGGERGPRAPQHAPPPRAPDHEITYATRPDQALLYRLSGDMNLLHSDPDFARRAGFERPILHGLCSFGFSGRALLHALCGSDPARLHAVQGRFARPVYPGESLTVQIWREDESAVFQTLNSARDPVITHGHCRFSR